MLRQSTLSNLGIFPVLKMGRYTTPELLFVAEFHTGTYV
jgi:hypothetical protein